MEFQTWFDFINELSMNVWIKAIGVVCIYAIFAKGADLFIDRILLRLTKKTAVEFDDQFVSFLHAPICWTVFWLGVLHALLIPPFALPWKTALPSLAKTAILLAWLIALINVVNKLAENQVKKNISRGKISNDIFHLVKNLLRVIFVVLGILWFLVIWDIDMTPLFASAGIVGIAVALAAKDTLANFFGGMSLFLDKTFKVGDYVILDSSERGEVVEVGIRSTRIKTRDDVLITIPNSILANSKIINESAPIPRFRIRVPVGVAYGSDLIKVEQELLAVAHANPKVSQELEPKVRVRVLGTSSVDIELLCWVDDPSLKGFVRHTLLREIHNSFQEKNIVIPFPQQDIYIKSTPDTHRQKE